MPYIVNLQTEHCKFKICYQRSSTFPMYCEFINCNGASIINLQKEGGKSSLFMITKMEGPLLFMVNATPIRLSQISPPYAG